MRGWVGVEGDMVGWGEVGGGEVGGGLVVVLAQWW